MKPTHPFRLGAQVCAYLRDSGHEDQELSIEQQEARIREFCLDNALLLTKIYKDAATPGSSTVGRDQFLEMIHHFRAGTPDAGVIVWKFSRFSRSVDDSQFYKADLRRRGYAIYSMNDSIPEGLDGRFFESAIDWMNARYLEDLRADVKRGQRHLVEQYGALGGSPPRGFMREPVQIGSHRDGRPHIVHRWVPDPALTKTIQTAWRMRVEGYTYDQINAATRLYKSTPAYDRFFSNRLYIGELQFSGQIITGYCDPIIDLATWEAVQKIQGQTIRPNRISAEDNPDHPKRAKSSFMLSGLLYCAQCGAIMNGEIVQFKTTANYRYEYYACSGQNRHTGCTARKIPRAHLENAVIDVICDVILDPKMVEVHHKQLEEEQKNAGAQYRRQRSDLTQQLQQIHKRINNITETIAEEGKTARTLLIKLNELEKEETRLLSSLTELAPDNTTTPGLEDLQSLALKLKNRLAEADPRIIRTITAGLISKITVEMDVEAHLIRGLVEYYYPPVKSDEGSPKSEDPSIDSFMPTGKCPGWNIFSRHKYSADFVIFYTPDHRKKR